MFSIPHMVVLFIIVLVVFGPQKLPELARSLGKLMAEFRKASTDFKGAFEEEMRGIERQALQVEREKAAAQVAASATGISPAQVAESAPASETEPGQLPESTSLPEGPVVTPVAESVARGEDPAAGPAAAESEPQRILPETAPTEASDQEQHV
ncbi:MAG TPA: twin-arginine translocase TatA/TatE family subunit [Candidatus Saccharimonadales bacterium]|nr:twin-arginine translocase TatA/TatE family subunit [Candidatus Saccharimonadales bacterium]